MGRIIEKIKIKGDPKSSGIDVFALFDSGSERSYIKTNAIPEDVNRIKIFQFTSKFGGSKRQITERCSLIGEINGLSFDFSAHPIDDIGIIDGKDIVVLIGATAMEEWDMKIYPKEKTIDLTALKKREFIEL